MLPVERIAELRLEHADGASETTHIEAASGLAIIAGTVYVIADDEAYIAVFRDLGRKEGRALPLLDRDVPSDPEERKEDKPDLESLTPIPAFGRFDHGGLIALGSGSGESRHRGAFAVFDSAGDIRSTVQLDAGPLMEELARRIPKLNLEGTAIAGDRFRIFQRGNEEGSINAHIDLDLEGLRDAIGSGGVLGGGLVGAIEEHDLGQIQGTKLCFSDADTLEDGLVVFSASAETQSEGGDGVSVGSAVGAMTPGGEVLWLEPIEADTKVEGLAATRREGNIHAYMVTDLDDPDRPTSLLRTTIPDQPAGS